MCGSEHPPRESTKKQQGLPSTRSCNEIQTRHCDPPAHRMLYVRFETFVALTPCCPPLHCLTQTTCTFTVTLCSLFVSADLIALFQPESSSYQVDSERAAPGGVEHLTRPPIPDELSLYAAYQPQWCSPLLLLLRPTAARGAAHCCSWCCALLFMVWCTAVRGTLHCCSWCTAVRGAVQLASNFCSAWTNPKAA